MGFFSKASKQPVAKVEEMVAEGVTKVELSTALAAGKGHVNALIDLSNKVADSRAANLITDVGFAMGALYDDFEKDPRDIDIARNFVTYHAPRAVELATTYVRAIEGGTFSDTDRAKAEETLRKVIEACAALLVKCKENDADGIEYQSESLKNIMGMQAVVSLTRF